MARPIHITEDIKQKILTDVKERLDKEPIVRAFKYEKGFTYETDMKATIVYSPIAWFKTRLIVDTQPKEVGWHGVCRRSDDGSSTYYIDDIMVYPQNVTGASIDPDPKEYTDWMNSLDDNTFNNLRFHGHSHVNMSVYSSSVDDKFRSDRISQLNEDDFYIFQVFNKRGDIHSEIFDCLNNVLFENQDIETFVDCDDMEVWDSYITIAKLLYTTDMSLFQDICDLYNDGGVNEFLDAAKSMVKEEVPKIPPAKGFTSKKKPEQRYHTKYNFDDEYDVYEDEQYDSEYQQILHDPYGYWDGSSYLK